MSVVRLTAATREEINTMIESSRRMHGKLVEKFPDLSGDDKEWLRFICSAVAVHGRSIAFAAGYRVP